MIKPDCLISWPKHIDYPLFRYNLKRFKPYFNEIYIAFTDMAQEQDYSQFLIEELFMTAQCKVLPRVAGTKDWRNEAMRTLLEKSDASHVLFLEQDFLIRDERFFEVLLSQTEYDFVYHKEGERVHPACALVKRASLNQTSKDFSAKPPAYDHFGLVFNQLIGLTNHTDLEGLGLHDKEDYFHLNGLSQNYVAEPYYQPEQFLTYNHYALNLPIKYSAFSLRMLEVDEAFDEAKEDPIVKSMFPIV